MGMNASSVLRISLLAAVALAILPSFAGAVWGVQSICNGSSTSNGIIPPNPILGTGTQGVTSVVALTLVVMLTVLLVTAFLYMISKIASLPTLENFVKVELAEMVGTAILIGIFFGGFYAASFAMMGPQTSTPNPTLHFNGPGRAVFVSDCTMLGNASIAMIPPIAAAGIVNFGLNTLTSLSIKITPGGFGVQDSPLVGWGMISSTLNELQGIMSAFVIVILAIVFMLGLIYSLFPIFLYLGIVMRAFPWTRAAGGIFIAMFIGFYIIFPLMLNATLSGFSSATYQNMVSYYNSTASAGSVNFTTYSSTSNNIGTVGPNSGLASSTGSVISYFFQTLYSMAGFPGGYGVVNGYIAVFMGPSVVIIVEIAFAFIVALDFADILSDLLGAPSLSGERLLSRVL